MGQLLFTSLICLHSAVGPCLSFLALLIIGRVWTSDRVQMAGLLGGSQDPDGKTAPQTASYTKRAVTRV